MQNTQDLLFEKCGENSEIRDETSEIKHFAEVNGASRNGASL
jgi:hypothetical protein